MFRGKNYLVLMDSALDGQYSDEDRTELIHLATRCLRFEPDERPSIKFLTLALSRLEKRVVLCPNVKVEKIPVSHYNHIYSSNVFRFFLVFPIYPRDLINNDRLYRYGTLNLQEGRSYCA